MPRVVRFRHVLAVGRAASSHWVTGAGETHLMHFAIVNVGAEYVVYDEGSAGGTFLGWSGATRWWRLSGDPAFLESGMFVRAGQLLFQYLDTRGRRVAPLPDLLVTPGSGWSWARGSAELPPPVRVPRAG